MFRSDYGWSDVFIPFCCSHIFTNATKNNACVNASIVTCSSIATAYFLSFLEQRFRGTLLFLRICEIFTVYMLYCLWWDVSLDFDITAVTLFRSWELVILAPTAMFLNICVTSHHCSSIRCCRWYASMASASQMAKGTCDIDFKVSTGQLCANESIHRPPSCDNCTCCSDGIRETMDVRERMWTCPWPRWLRMLTMLLFLKFMLFP